MNFFCSAAIVTPMTFAPKCSAACSESDPQPQPTSSRVVPGSRPSLRQTRSSLSRWASLERYDGSAEVQYAQE